MTGFPDGGRSFDTAAAKRNAGRKTEPIAMKIPPQNVAVPGETELNREPIRNPNDKTVSLTSNKTALEKRIKTKSPV